MLEGPTSAGDHSILQIGAARCRQGRLRQEEDRIQRAVPDPCWWVHAAISSGCAGLRAFCVVCILCCRDCTKQAPVSAANCHADSSPHVYCMQTWCCWACAGAICSHHILLPIVFFLSRSVAALTCWLSTFGGTCCKPHGPPPVWQHLSWPHLPRNLICTNNNDFHKKPLPRLFPGP